MPSALSATGLALGSGEGVGDAGTLPAGVGDALAFVPGGCVAPEPGVAPEAGVAVAGAGPAPGELPTVVPAVHAPSSNVAMKIQR